MDDDFREQCRRQMKRSMRDRMKYGFFRNPKPVFDDEPYRFFSSTAEYRKWADENLPEYLGYKTVSQTDDE